MLLLQDYDRHLAQLTDAAERVCRAMQAAGISYRVVGGLAVLFHVQSRDPLAGRLTKDVDLAIDRADLPRIVDAVRSAGLEYRHAAGVDMLVDAKEPKARSAVHLVFVREKVRPQYVEPVPDFSEPVVADETILVAPVADLVRMKLTSFRIVDKTHIIDLDSVGLITPDIEKALPEILRERLDQVRKEERQSTGAE
ncbi:MAG: nucleotidyltransferase family protein [Acidobacteriia bacterium]|nr:nucleotidyltransferase family protein [Terriglobia bacterium]